MDLPDTLLRGIYAYGFEKPSAIQQRAIKPAILGRDLIAQAQSGMVRLTLFDFPCWTFLKKGPSSFHEESLNCFELHTANFNARLSVLGMKILIQVTFRV
jgi:hypothetical protein